MNKERELKKKKWAKPKLIILTRRNEQEMVLTGCKQQWQGAASGTTWHSCQRPRINGYCVTPNCAAITTS